MPKAKEFGLLGLAGGLVVGVGLASTAVQGAVGDLIHQRDVYRNQVQALEAHSHEPSLAPTPTQQPTAPAAGPAPSSSPTSTPSPKVLQVVVHSSTAAGGPPSGPSSPGPSGPSPTPAPRPSASCPAASMVAVRLPVGVLPCNAVSVGGR